MILVELRKQLQEKVKEWGETWRNTPPAERARDDMMREMIDRASNGFINRVAQQIVHDSTLAMGQATVQCTSCRRAVFRNEPCPDCGAYNS